VDDYIVKSLFLLANSQEINNHESSVYTIALKLLKHNSNSIQLIDAIEEFITLGYNRALSKYNKPFVFDVITTILEKLSSGAINGSERICFLTKGMHNIYSVAQQLNITYKNRETTKALVSQLQRLSDEEKARAVETIIYDLYLIGSNSVRTILSSFVKTIPSSKLNPENQLRLGLFLMASGIMPLNSSLAEEAFKSMDRFEKYKYSTEAINFESLLRYLVETKEMKEYSPALEKIANIVKQYEA
jgi:hypothetical protein